MDFELSREPKHLLYSTLIVHCLPIQSLESPSVRKYERIHTQAYPWASHRGDDDATPQVHSSDLPSTLDQDEQQFGTGLLIIYLRCLANHCSGPADDTIITIILTLTRDLSSLLVSYLTIDSLLTKKITIKMSYLPNKVCCNAVLSEIDSYITQFSLCLASEFERNLSQCIIDRRRFKTLVVVAVVLFGKQKITQLMRRSVIIVSVSCLNKPIILLLRNNEPMMLCLTKSICQPPVQASRVIDTMTLAGIFGFL